MQSVRQCHFRAVPRRFVVAWIGTLFVLAVGMSSPVLAQQQGSTTTGPLEPLDIVTASGTHHFSVEVMRTEPQLEQGLMYRRYLPADRGMLFDFKVEQPVEMWMKNTYLPLDMVFMSHTGEVINIAADREPLSEQIIPSEGPTYAVLELNAGAAAKIGLKIGDQVKSELFGSAPH